MTGRNIVSGDSMGKNNKEIRKEIEHLKQQNLSLDRQEAHPCYLFYDLTADNKVYKINIITSSIVYNEENGKYAVQIDKFPETEIFNIRFDPLEEHYCIIDNIKVKINNKKSNIKAYNGFRINNTDVFYSTDPQYIIKSKNMQIKSITIEFDNILKFKKELIESYPHLKKLLIDRKQNKYVELLLKTVRYFSSNGFLPTIKRSIDYIKTRRYSKVSVNNVPYDAWFQSNHIIENCKTNIKPVAFYLPQFHTFKENNEWWGEGFTEWTNTRKATPKYEGHYQPREPHDDFGYYTLDNKEMLQKQAKLAKEHGIYGFCFYYYWFSGKRLMEKPLDIFLANKDIDINFCLCWANENWTRTWDGLEKNVLIKQDYTEEDDINFIKDLKKYIDDERYIKVDNKPVIIVYNPKAIPDCKKTFAAWRKTAKETGIGEILIWICQTHDINATKLNIINDVDGEIEFPPHKPNIAAVDLNKLYFENGCKPSALYYYESIINSYLMRNRDKSNTLPVYKTVTLAWDNSARRNIGWVNLIYYSLESFYGWVNDTVRYTEKAHKKDKQFMFINAWNEWAEGTYLEPDKKTGYANINTFSRALYNLPFMKEPLNIEKCSSINYFNDKTEIAVQAHIFYTDLAEEIIGELNKIPYKFDCYISTDTDEKAEILMKVFKKSSKAENIYVEVFDNRGRDMLPFVSQISKVLDKYKYICHIHSKKTLTNTVGEEWRKYLFKNLFGSKENIVGIFDIFENTNTGIIFPATFHAMITAVDWGSNFDNTEKLLKKMNIDIMLPENHLIFPVGNMFWAKISAVRQIFENCASAEDYALEAGQVDGTTAHAIERLWVYLAEYNGYTYTNTANKTR